MARGRYPPSLRRATAPTLPLPCVLHNPRMAIDHSVPVGGDVLTHCSRCENAPNSSVTEPLWHTVVAKVGPLIVRVRCNTCRNEHAIRGETRAHKEPRGA